MNLLLENAIKNATVVSFDIFDTLLIRPYCKPTDLFLHLERIHQTEGFATARIEAEKRARKVSPREDIFFDEIYKFIDIKYAHLKEHELKLEKQILHKNTRATEIYNYAKSLGKRIIITSDMYFDSEFLKSVLLKEGFSFEKLYVSSEIGKTKWSGTLFDYILRDLNISPEQILHIGDNAQSDVEIPKRKGIFVYHVNRLVEEFFSKNKNFSEFYDIHRKDIACSILFAICSEYDGKNDYWQKFGYFYGGIAAVSYIQWMLPIIKRKHIEQILFIARDGYSLSKVFNVFCNDIKSFYVAAPRLLASLITWNYGTRLHEANFLKNKYFEYIGEPRIPDFNNIDEANIFFEGKKQKIEEIQRYYFNKYNLYLKNKGVFEQKISATVDTYSWNCTGQNMLSRFIPSAKDNGVYIQSHQNNELHHEAFLKKDSKKFQYFKKWDLMEFIFTAPTPPIIDISQNGTPIFDYTHAEYEKIRMELYSPVSDGIVKFAEKIKNIFDDIPIFASGEFISQWINFFTDHFSQEDGTHFQNVYHATDSNHGCYSPIFATTSGQSTKESVYLFDTIPLKIDLVHWRNLMKVKYHKIEIFKIKHKPTKFRFYVFGICIFSKRISS